MVIADGECSRSPKSFPHATGFSPQLIDAEPERRLLTGREARDDGREKWEGEAPADPKH